MLIRLFLIGVALFFAALTSHAASPVSDKPIYFYISPLTASYLQAKGTSNNTTLATWRKYLRKACKCFTEVTRAELLGKLKPGVLILASAELLDDEERQAIQDFSMSGGSLLATWMTGTRDAKGGWKGYGFLNNLFQIRVAGEFTRLESEDWFLMPFGDGPLTWGVPAGRRMFTGDAGQNMLRVESDHLAAVGMSWERGKDDVGPNGVIAFHEASTYRGVYFSFPESAWGFSRQADMLSILDGTLAWLSREPRLFKSAWPDAKIAAQLIEMDTEDQFFAAPNFANDLESIGLKGTFYSLTSEAIRYPEIVKDLLARGHEIAYHADVHLGFDNVAASKQEARILNMKTEMQTILGENMHLATGFRAPTESYNATTEMLLRKHGMLHHAADPASTEDRLPFFSKVEPLLGPDQALVVLPRTQYDDVSYSAFDFGSKKTLETMVYDLDLIVRGGAFGLLSVHTQNYVDGRLLQKVMPGYMQKVATYKDRIWLPRADQVAAWWRKRETVRVKQSHQGKDLVLQMSVSPPGSVDGLTVLVINPVKNTIPIVQGRSSNAVKVKVVPVDAYRSGLVFDTLSVGDFEYLVRFP